SVGSFHQPERPSDGNGQQRSLRGAIGGDDHAGDGKAEICRAEEQRARDDETAIELALDVVAGRRGLAPIPRRRRSRRSWGSLRRSLGGQQRTGGQQGAADEKAKHWAKRSRPSADV